MLSERSISLLAENRIRNDKSWYESNKKEIWKHTVDEFKLLAEELAPTIKLIDEEIVCLPASKTVSRIRRDTRYTHDKSLYRDSMWLTFRRNKHIYPLHPAFFFEISPSIVRYGCGYYATDISTMDSLRRILKENGKEAKKVLKLLKERPDISVEGEEYKKDKCPDLSGIAKSIGNRKDVFFPVNLEDYSLAFSPDLAEHLKKEFLAMKPIYELLIKAEEEKNV